MAEASPPQKIREQHRPDADERLNHQNPPDARAEKDHQETEQVRVQRALDERGLAAPVARRDLLRPVVIEPRVQIFRRDERRVLHLDDVDQAQQERQRAQRRHPHPFWNRPPFQGFRHEPPAIGDGL